MNDKKDFEAALKGKKVPLLVLDQKWHRLFAIHGKTDEISATEKELDELLKLQGKYNNELKNLKKLKSKIMSNIVANMGDDGDENRDKQQQEYRRVDEIGIILIDAHIDEQQHEAHAERQSDPAYLLARELGKIEDARVVKVIARGIDADRSRRHEQQVDNYCRPVDIAENRWISAFLCH
mgnify:CR=1 FL=1